MRSPNRLLDMFSDGDYALIAPHLTPTEMVHRQDIELPHQPFEFVYFPEGGISSVVAISGAEKVETNIIGWDGMSGVCLINGSDRSPLHTFVQIPGAAQRITVAHFRAALDASRSLHASCLLFAEANSIQVAHTALANGRHSIEERLARWLLMCLDRHADDHLELTHEFLSLMLGVRRAGVTTALHVLEGGLMIRATRGLIVVRDRCKLEKVAGDSYGVPETEYRRLIGREIGGRAALSPAVKELAETAIRPGH
jgi:hypothetical protein